MENRERPRRRKKRRGSGKYNSETSKYIADGNGGDGGQYSTLRPTNTGRKGEEDGEVCDKCGNEVGRNTNIPGYSTDDPSASAANKFSTMRSQITANFDLNQPKSEQKQTQIKKPRRRRKDATRNTNITVKNVDNAKILEVKKTSPKELALVLAMMNPPENNVQGKIEKTEQIPTSNSRQPKQRGTELRGTQITQMSSAVNYNSDASQQFGTIRNKTKKGEDRSKPRLKDAKLKDALYYSSGDDSMSGTEMTMYASKPYKLNKKKKRRHHDRGTSKGTKLNETYYSDAGESATTADFTAYASDASMGSLYSQYNSSAENMKNTLKSNNRGTQAGDEKGNRRRHKTYNGPGAKRGTAISARAKAKASLKAEDLVAQLVEFEKSQKEKLQSLEEQGQQSSTEMEKPTADPPKDNHPIRRKRKNKNNRTKRGKDKSNLAKEVAKIDTNEENVPKRGPGANGTWRLVTINHRDQQIGHFLDTMLTPLKEQIKEEEKRQEARDKNRTVRKKHRNKNQTMREKEAVRISEGSNRSQSLPSVLGSPPARMPMPPNAKGNLSGAKAL